MSDKFDMPNGINQYGGNAITTQMHSPVRNDDVTFCIGSIQLIPETTLAGAIDQNQVAYCPLTRSVD